MVVHQPGHQPAHLAFPCVGIERHQPFGGEQVQHPVAQELEPLIVADLQGAVAHAGVGQGPFQKLAVMKGVADPALKLGDRDFALVH